MPSRTYRKQTESSFFVLQSVNLSAITAVYAYEHSCFRILLNSQSDTAVHNSVAVLTEVYVALSGDELIKRLIWSLLSSLETRLKRLS